MLHVLFSDLQLFGEGGDGGAGAAPGGTPGPQSADPGATAQDAAEQRPKHNRPKRLDVEYGQPKLPAAPPAEEKQHAEQTEQAEPPKEDYAAVKQRYHSEIGKDIEKAVLSRHRDYKDLEARAQESERLLARLAENKYGLLPGDNGRLDLNAVRTAMDEDDDLYAKLADELGTSVEFAKQRAKDKEKIRTLEAERKQRDDRDFYQNVQRQAEEAKKLYPSLNLMDELDNPDFARLIRNHVPVETAYFCVHRAELTAGAIQHASDLAKQQAAETILAGQRRPVENALTPTASTATTRILDPKTLTPQQRADLKRRVGRGEKIVW